MKKILLLSFVIGFVFNCNAQQFDCKMKFVDAVGHIDSLILGYDATATDSIDPAFGETNIITTPFTSGIDVRAGNVCTKSLFNDSCRYGSVFTDITSKRLNNIDISTLKTGIYIIKVTNKTGFTSTTKFQKVL